MWVEDVVVGALAPGVNVRLQPPFLELHIFAVLALLKGLHCYCSAKCAWITASPA